MEKLRNIARTEAMPANGASSSFLSREGHVDRFENITSRRYLFKKALDDWSQVLSLVLTVMCRFFFKTSGSNIGKGLNRMRDVNPLYRYRVKADIMRRILDGYIFKNREKYC